MKHALLILALCLPGFGAIALVQSNSGGAATTTSSVNPVLLNSAASSYSVTTTAGNFLAVVVWCRASTGSSGGFDTPLLVIPTSSGITWTQATVSGGWQNLTLPTQAGAVAIYYVANAPSFSGTVTAQCHIGNSPASSLTVTIDYALYEFSGVRASSPSDVFGDIFASSGGSHGGTGLFTTTVNNDLILAAYSGDPNTGSNVTAGAGFTLGLGTTNSTLGQSQYELDAGTAGSKSFVFNSVPATFYHAVGVAFKPPAAPASGVARHKGYVF